MSEHAPVKWITKETMNITTGESRYVILWSDTSKPGVHWRRLDDSGHFTEQDAKLISAAPEIKRQRDALLAAIKVLADDWESLVGNDIEDNEDVAAINKQVGEAIAMCEKEGV
jgi:hypothetical protein